MKLIELIKNFKSDESGAITVDWVVLTAAIVGLGIALATVIFPQTETIAQNIDTELQNNSTLDTALDGN